MALILSSMIIGACFLIIIELGKDMFCKFNLYG